MPRILFTELARQESVDAEAFYELELSGLGKVFRAELKSAIQRIADYPEAWSCERGEIRKCLLHKFPFKVLYSIETDHLLIVALAHQHRNPDYWIDRL
ncbi:ParE toxin of type II toxin-antitoxin system, parDE [Marinospirillum celere]|uniref:ParE toxin of type II toxin-antitoxin system, parDE n=1 Tax=Marinospirillum celere TaxID=1122252 RepID=A0A1I1JI94_9GAMM|nr:type II toxin-antitoxin system RelE/ParE family toxin [Marinospirillum celere]SFC45180.1 ParE toxin of type II toxin-antitoxin system, parDE [Marinospirillum celere]